MWFHCMSWLCNSSMLGAKGTHVGVKVVSSAATSYCVCVYVRVFMYVRIYTCVCRGDGAFNWFVWTRVLAETKREGGRPGVVVTANSALQPAEMARRGCSSSIRGASSSSSSIRGAGGSDSLRTCPRARSETGRDAARQRCTESCRHSCGRCTMIAADNTPRASRNAPPVQPPY